MNQARTTIGNTSKNPAVGCAITKDNILVGIGSTSINGRPHAEHNAINFSKINLSNSNLYVTLEPCSHYGKTNPCVNKIINKKIKKVFFSIKDPDIRSFNKSTKILKRKNIKVNIGLNSKIVNDFYRSYKKFKSNELPFVTSKIAASRDFFTINKKKRWITNLYSRQRVHLIRSIHDCILTSSITIIKDNPSLTCRVNGLENYSPFRVILDKNLSLPINSKIVRNNFDKKTIIFFNKNNKKKINLLKKLGIKVYQIPLDNDKKLNLRAALFKIKELGFSRILLEAGINLTTSFFEQNLINDFKIFVSNKKINRNGKGCLKSYFNTFLKNKKPFKEKVYLFGDNLMSYKIK